MTAREMQIEFERRLALINPELANNQKPDSDTIFSFLNAYTLRFVQQIFNSEDSAENGTRIQKYGKDSIYTLLTKTVLTAVPSQSTDLEPNNHFFSLPNDYFLYVRSTSGVNVLYDFKTGKLRRVPNELVSEEELNKILTSAWDQIILPHPHVSLNTGSLGVQISPRLNLIADKYTTVYDLQLVYYRRPKLFNVLGVDGETVLDACELPEATHLAIVDGAVNMFIAENKYRLSANTKQDKE